MEYEPLQPRLAAFARDVRLFAKALVRDIDASDAAVQLRRAASSAAANHRSAQRGRSYAEFRSKLDVALEEADEAQFWLQHIADCDLAPREQLAPLRREAGELVAILTSASKTAWGRGRSGRAGRDAKPAAPRRRKPHE
jgi:four helix bundle protein